VATGPPAAEATHRARALNRRTPVNRRMRKRRCLPPGPVCAPFLTASGRLDMSILIMSILEPSTGPLKPAELFVLAVLRNGPLHGYGLVQEVDQLSQGRIKIRPGNLYCVLDRMLERGFIETAPALDDRRTFYRITSQGRKAALADARLLATVIA